MRHLLVKLLILIVPLLALIFFIAFAPQERIDYGQVCMKERCFYTEIPSGHYNFFRGLTFRDQLDQDKSMLFIFASEGVYPFEMRDMRFALDIIWINKNREVVFISNNAQPCNTTECPNINPGKNARYVLEINAGIADDIGLAVGDKVSFDQAIEDLID